MPTPDFVTAAQAAAMVGVNRRTITKWVESGTLPLAFKVPKQTGTMLFQRADVERLAADRRTQLEAELAALAPAGAGEQEERAAGVES